MKTKYLNNYSSNTFGGTIYEQDFYIPGPKKITRNSSRVADRIASNWKFDRACVVRGRFISRKAI